MTPALVLRVSGPGKEGCPHILLSHYLAIVRGGRNWDGGVSFDWWLVGAAAVAGALCVPFRIAALLVESSDRRRLLDQIGTMFGILSMGWIILALLV